MVCDAKVLVRIVLTYVACRFSPVFLNLQNYVRKQTIRTTTLSWHRAQCGHSSYWTEMYSVPVGRKDMGISEASDLGEDMCKD